MLYPEGRKNVLFNRGYSFNIDSDLNKFSLFLGKINIIKVKTNKIYKCVNSKDKDYSTLNGEEYQCSGNMYYNEKEDILICELCGRDIEQTYKNPIKQEKVVLNINYEVINNYIKKSLDKVKIQNEKVITIRKLQNRSSWKLALKDGKELYVHLIDNIDSNYILNLNFLYGNEIFIALSEKYICEGIINGVSIIESKYNNLELAIESLIYEKDNCDRYIEIKKLIRLFDEELSGQEDWGFFEDKFSNLFIELLSKKNSEIINYYRFLERNKGNIKGSMIVNLGGSSNPDIDIKSKFDYYKNIFKIDYQWDPKCYISSKITTHELDSVNRHLDSYSSRSDGAIILAWTDNISADVWVESSRINYNTKKNIIIMPKSIICEFIYEMGVVDEFIELIHEYQRFKA